MDSSALVRFFEIPELTSIVVSHLTMHDVSRLLKTCRFMHTAMIPTYYQNLRVFYQANRLWESPVALRAFARNIFHVKTFTIDLFFMAYYYHATTAFYYNNNQNDIESNANISYSNGGSDNITYPNIDNGATSIHAVQVSHPVVALPISFPENPLNTPQLPGSSRAIPFHFFPETINTIEVVPLPEMPRLTKLVLILSWYNTESKRSYHSLKPSDSKDTIFQLCKILSLLPRLQELSLRDTLVRDFGSAKLLRSTLMNMVKLRILDITFPFKRPSPGIATWFFFSCPSSVEDLYIGKSFILDHDEIEDNNDESSGSGSLIGQGMRGRLMALSNLRTLDMSEWPEDITKEDFLLIFEHCPRLEKLTMNEIAVPNGVHGADVGRLCPNLREIIYCGPSNMEHKNTYPFEIMETLRENQLECFCFFVESLSSYCLDEVATRNTICRHSRTLRDIDIEVEVVSTALGMILKECEALEDLKVKESVIDLNDAVAFPWASCKMKFLRLYLRISQPSSPDIQYTPYYLRTPPSQPSADDHRIFAQLDIFYRQIGKQKDITNLYLYWIKPISTQSPYSYLNPFHPTLYPLPGMLVLENNNNAGARPGFLQLLGGLTKLTSLGHSIYPDTPSRKIADDALEADWIAEYWPLLNHHDFLPYSGPEGAMLRRKMKKEMAEKGSGTEGGEALEEKDGIRNYGSL
jgi:hypothetical protein